MKILRIVLLCTLLAAAFTLLGCSGADSGRPSQYGDKVAVHYTGTLEDGSVFDSSRERGPLEFTLGAGEMIPGFENAVWGMKVGETKTVTIPKNTVESAPVLEKFGVAHGVITRVEVEFPDGCSGLVSVHIDRALHQVWPTNPDGVLSSNGRAIVWADYYEMFTDPNESAPNNNPNFIEPTCKMSLA